MKWNFHKPNGERIFKSIYGMVQVGILVLTLYTFKPESGDLRDDLRTIGLMILSCLLALPSSILSAPLALFLGITAAFAFSITIKQFIDLERLSDLPETIFVFLFWLGIFIGGYWQWFGFPQQLRNIVCRRR